MNTNNFASSSSSAARALSPFFAAAATQVAGTSSVPQDAGMQTADLVRITAIQAATSVDQVIGLIPDDYRSTLAPELRAIAAVAEKRQKALASAVRLEGLVKNGYTSSNQLPPHLRAAVPQLQAPKEFASQAEFQKAKDEAEADRKAYEGKTLARAAKLKRDEVDHYDTECKLESLIERCRALVVKRWAEHVAPHAKVPKWEYSATADFSAAAEEGEIRNVRINGWKTSPAKQVEFRAIVNDLAYLITRVMAFEEAKAAAASRAAEKKRSIVKDADIEMADVATSAASIQSLVDKAVNAKVQQVLAKVSVRLEPHPRRLSSPTLATARAGEGRPSRIAAGSQRPSAGHPHAVSQARDGEGREGQGGEIQARKGKRRAGRERQEEVEQLRPQAQAERQRQAQRQGRQAGSQGEQVDGYVHGFPRSLPDRVLTMSNAAAIDYVLLNTPISVIEASRFRNIVHLAPNVYVPLEYQYDLSVGLKYMYSAPIRVSLIMDAWRDFRRRLEWKILFAFSQGHDADFDPDYHIPRVSTKRVKDMLPNVISYGLDKGEAFCLQSVAKIPYGDLVETRRGPLNTLAPSPARIRQFLVDHDYVVTPTDKNLGLVVSQRDWINEQTLKLLNNINDYAYTAKFAVDRVHYEQVLEILDIAGRAEAVPELSDLGVPQFLVHKCNVPENWDGTSETLPTQHVPVFYGIPKIHKKPTGFRPILPCHSTPINPAAKFVSKQIKPLVLAAPTIIQSSIDLARKLDSISLKPTRYYWIVSGDVVAFYPNIPLRPCLAIIREMWLAHRYKDDSLYTYPDDADKYDFRRINEIYNEVFARCLRVGNTRLITQFNDVYYMQRRGLAMGVADSPDLANLYGWHFESKSGILTDPEIAFYGRFIDDMLGVVETTSRISKEEAIQKVSSRINFDGCKIEWNASETEAVFLDMTIRLSRSDGRVHYAPYRKDHNHMERIPWISHHPLDVKRGTFIGELSRLANLSSELLTYKRAVQELVNLYHKRGYPAQLIDAWVQKYAADRWKKRHSDSAKKADADDTSDRVLILKSTYNTAWNYFNATELGASMLGYWREWYERAERGDYDDKFPEWDVPLPQDFGSQARYLTPITSLGEAPDYQSREIEVPDLRKILITEHRVLVSKKRGRNMLDLANLWKKQVLQKLDEKVVEEHVQREPITLPGELDLTVERNADPRSDAWLRYRKTHREGNLHQRSSSEERDKPQF